MDEDEYDIETVMDWARRYLVARYGDKVWFRAPETFENVLERWIWAIAQNSPDMAESCMKQIENHFKERMS